jgi:hypothetical protein
MVTETVASNLGYSKTKPRALRREQICKSLYAHNLHANRDSWSHESLIINTSVPPYPLIQYPRFNAARKKLEN